MVENHIRRLKNQVRDGKVGVPRKCGKRLTSDLHLDGADGHAMKHKRRFGCSVCDAELHKQRRASIASASNVDLSELSLRTSDCVHSETHCQIHGVNIEDGEVEAQPSESYLRGALWLGRNILLVIQDLSVDLDLYRSEVNVTVPRSLFPHCRSC